MLAEIGHRVEVEIERLAGEQVFSGELRVPHGEQPRHLLRGDARGVFRQEALLGHSVEPAEQCQPLVGDQRHHVALAFNRPELEGQRGAERMRGRDHARAGQLGALRQSIAVEAHQIGDEQEQPSHRCGELARVEDKVADIGDGLGVGTDADGALLVEPARQGRKTLRGQNLAHRGGAQRRSLFLERLADLVDGVVALAQRHDLLMSAALLGLSARARMGGGEELRQRSTAKGMAQHAESTRRIAEALRDLGRRQSLHVEGPQGLVLPLAWGRGRGEEAAAIR